MSATIIELNDFGIRCSDGSQCLLESPGFALVQADGVVVGEYAQRQARLDPLNTHYQFWHKLNTEPLPTNNPNVRHYGDLVYLQLQDITRNLKKESSLVLSIPGSFSHEQLALLLGICQSLALDVSAMVDSSVIALSSYTTPGQHMYLDLQLNQSLITQVKIDQQVESIKSHAIPEQGWQSLMDHLAKVITGEFIRQVRFDPKHTASSEQILYNQMPLWLKQSQQQKDIKLEVESQEIQLSNQFFNQHINGFFQPLLRKLQQIPNDGHCLYSQRWHLLNAITQQIPTSVEVASNQVASNCISNLQQLHDQSQNGISFITALTSSMASPKASSKKSLSSSQGSEHSPQGKLQPSHILWQDHAYPLSASACFLSGNPQSPINAHANGNYVARIQGGKLHLQSAKQSNITLNKLPVTSSMSISVGDELALPELAQPLKFIHVKEQL